MRNENKMRRQRAEKANMDTNRDVEVEKERFFLDSPKEAKQTKNRYN